VEFLASNKNDRVDWIMIYVTGETDWKVIAIDVTDPLAADLKGKH